MKFSEHLKEKLTPIEDASDLVAEIKIMITKYYNKLAKGDDKKKLDKLLDFLKTVE